MVNGDKVTCTFVVRTAVEYIEPKLKGPVTR